MGYTHYMKMDKDLELSDDQKILLNYVMEDHKDLIDQTDGPDFQTEDHMIFLNGIGDEAHETFAVPRKAAEFEFCKTARKPYDIVVCKMLLILSQSPGFTFSSDGIYKTDTGKLTYDEEWQEPVKWITDRGFDGDKIIEDMSNQA